MTMYVASLHSNYLAIPMIAFHGDESIYTSSCIIYLLHTYVKEVVSYREAWSINGIKECLESLQTSWKKAG